MSSAGAMTSREDAENVLRYGIAVHPPTSLQPKHDLQAALLAASRWNPEHSKDAFPLSPFEAFHPTNAHKTEVEERLQQYLQVLERHRSVYLPRPVPRLVQQPGPVTVAVGMTMVPAGDVATDLETVEDKPTDGEGVAGSLSMARSQRKRVRLSDVGGEQTSATPPGAKSMMSKSKEQRVPAADSATPPSTSPPSPQNSPTRAAKPETGNSADSADEKQGRTRSRARQGLKLPRRLLAALEPPLERSMAPTETADPEPALMRRTRSAVTVLQLKRELQRRATTVSRSSAEPQSSTAAGADQASTQDGEVEPKPIKNKTQRKPRQRKTMSLETNTLDELPRPERLTSDSPGVTEAVDLPATDEASSAAILAQTGPAPDHMDNGSFAEMSSGVVKARPKPPSARMMKLKAKASGSEELLRSQDRPDSQLGSIDRNIESVSKPSVEAREPQPKQLVELEEGEVELEDDELLTGDQEADLHGHVARATVDESMSTLAANEEQPEAAHSVEPSKQSKKTEHKYDAKTNKKKPKVDLRASAQQALAEGRKLTKKESRALRFDLLNERKREIEARNAAMQEARNQKASSQRPPCRFFFSSKGCQNPHCPFSHEGPDPLSSIPCKHFIMGVCREGDKCRYSHDMSKIPCRSHHGLCGMKPPCKLGSKCKFMHGPPLSPEARAEFELEHQIRSERNRVLAGTAHGEERQETFKSLLAQESQLRRSSRAKQQATSDLRAYEAPSDEGADSIFAEVTATSEEALDSEMNAGVISAGAERGTESVPTEEAKSVLKDPSNEQVLSSDFDLGWDIFGEMSAEVKNPISSSDTQPYQPHSSDGVSLLDMIKRK